MNIRNELVLLNTTLNKTCLSIGFHLQVLVIGVSNLYCPLTNLWRTLCVIAEHRLRHFEICQFQKSLTKMHKQIQYQSCSKTLSVSSIFTTLPHQLKRLLPCPHRIKYFYFDKTGVSSDLHHSGAWNSKASRVDDQLTNSPNVTVRRHSVVVMNQLACMSNIKNTDCSKLCPCWADCQRVT